MKLIHVLNYSISIVVMILANYGAGHYNFLEHATWNGLNVADLVFPWFMWIMGVCIPISIKSALKRNEQLIFYNILRVSIHTYPSFKLFL